MRVQVEAGIDFPDEHLDLAAQSALRARADALHAELQQLLAAAAQGRVLTEGLTVVIAGRPNAGKSTLLNRLAGFDAAIVTPIAGTTRDLLREHITIGGIPFELIDTAGLRSTTSDAIEEEGMRRARDAITRADHVLFVVDAVDDPQAASLVAERASLPADVPVTVVMNKTDLVARALRARTGHLPCPRPPAQDSNSCAHTWPHWQVPRKPPAAPFPRAPATSKHCGAQTRIWIRRAFTWFVRIRSWPPRNCARHNRHWVQSSVI